MPAYFSDEEFRVVEAICARLIPTDQDPGATEAGVAHYIDTFLGAFSFDPPRIWAGGPYSGRFGTEGAPGSPSGQGLSDFHRLTPHEELAWRTRIEGSLGRPEREWNGPVTGLQERYAEGLRGLGADFADVDEDEQDRRLHEHHTFTALVYEHACEGMYGAPEYGGNRDLKGWRYINFAGDVQPVGYSDEEVSQP
jgi:gluconate 2-dehydrogenase subunit 3-like protein